jgi:hypothetical protein
MQLVGQPRPLGVGEDRFEGQPQVCPPAAKAKRDELPVGCRLFLLDEWRLALLDAE